MIRYVEFLQISLLRSGLVDQRRLDAIRNQFDVLDINSDQKVSRLEVAAMVCVCVDLFHCVDVRHLFSRLMPATFQPGRMFLQAIFNKFDVNSSGNIDFLEFVLRSQCDTLRRKRLSRDPTVGPSHILQCGCRTPGTFSVWTASTNSFPSLSTHTTTRCWKTSS